MTMVRASDNLLLPPTHTRIIPKEISYEFILLTLVLSPFLFLFLSLFVVLFLLVFRASNLIEKRPRSILLFKLGLPPKQPSGSDKGQRCNSSVEYRLR